MTYKEQLKDPRWYEKREEIKLRDLNKCVKCKSKKNLHIHHLYYDLNKLAWEYPTNAYLTLCSDCHYKMHESEILSGVPQLFMNIKKLINNISILNLSKELELEMLIKTCLMYLPHLFSPTKSPQRMIFKHSNYAGDIVVQNLIQTQIDSLCTYIEL